jgi:hypothetical protein
MSQNTGLPKNPVISQLAVVRLVLPAEPDGSHASVKSAFLKMPHDSFTPISSRSDLSFPPIHLTIGSYLI